VGKGVLVGVGVSVGSGVYVGGSVAVGSGFSSSSALAVMAAIVPAMASSLSLSGSHPVIKTANRTRIKSRPIFFMISSNQLKVDD
jgi:hypothetical protein